MANKNFPGPNINRLIENDPQIVKIPFDTMGWGSRRSVWGHMKGSSAAQTPTEPSAPEMGLKHVPNEK